MMRLAILCCCALVAGADATAARADALGRGWSSTVAAHGQGRSDGPSTEAAFRGGSGGGGFDRGGFHDDVVVNRDVNVGGYRGGYGYGWGGVAAGAAVGTAVGAAAASTAYAADPYPYGYPYPPY